MVGGKATRKARNLLDTSAMYISTERFGRSTKLQNKVINISLPVFFFFSKFNIYLEKWENLECKTKTQQLI